MKTYYDILGVPKDASLDEIKRTFRREIARYHPDKVQHLGKEFQELAATRASELTEAYRVLMDEKQRADYDEGLGTPSPSAAAEAPAAAGHGRPSEAEAPRAPAAAAAGSDAAATAERVGKERSHRDDFVRKAALARFHDAIVAEFGSADSLALAGFDMAYLTRPRRALFKKAAPPVRILGRFVARVDAAAVHEAWPLAGRSATGETTVLFLMGNELAASRELATAISEARKKQARSAPPLVLVPLDVRDWNALMPADAPDVTRALLGRLKAR